MNTNTQPPSPIFTCASSVTVNAQAIVAANPEHRDVGDLAVWSVTSAKPGNGVELLRDNKTDTYWQSDGTQPHLINIQFQKNLHLAELHLHLDYKADESYTPNKISIRTGTDYHDLKEMKVVELEEPLGWVVVPLRADGDEDMLKACIIQVAVLSNHQNGRDTHIRQIKVFGPRRDPIRSLGYPIQFTSSEMLTYATVR